MRTTALWPPSASSASRPWLLSGCSADHADESGPVTITYTNFISNGGNEENLQTIVDAFEKENPDITVEVTTLPYADYFTALQTDLAAGTGVDVFDIEYANYAPYQANGVLRRARRVENPDAYKQSLLEAYSTDGTQYALPSSFSTVVLYYNKDLFDAAGLDYPTADWTWADEQAAAEKLTDEAAGVWGDHQPVSFYEFYKALAQNGGEFLDDRRHEGRVQLARGHRGRRVARRQERHRDADDRAGPGHARLRHQPVQGRQARDAAHRHLDVRRRRRRAVRLGHRRRAGQHRSRPARVFSNAVGVSAESSTPRRRRSSPSS